MPIYTFKDKNSDLEVDVVRSFEDYQVPPTDDELPEEERGKVRDWLKLVGSGIKTIRGANWRGGKGYW